MTAKPTAADTVSIRVIEWPSAGAAKRFGVGGWYVVEHRPGRGYTPLAGPFRWRSDADAERDRIIKRR